MGKLFTQNFEKLMFSILLKNKDLTKEALLRKNGETTGPLAAFD
jgi:hypothetical protein